MFRSGLIISVLITLMMPPFLQQLDGQDNARLTNLKQTDVQDTIVPTASCRDSGGEIIDEDPPVPCRTIIRKDACGTIDIGNNLNWLNTLIVTSYSDQSGIYRGKIWVSNYRGIDYIVTDMPLIAGYTGYHVFQCDGSETVINDNAYFASLKNSYLIWMSYCPQPGTTD